MPRVVLDTSALYAVISASDAFHEQARVSYERLLDWEWEIYITSYILVETSVLVHRRLGFEPLKTLTETMMSGLTRVVWIGKTIHDEAWRRMAQREGKGLSLVDWTTIVVAEGTGASVFTFDQGFRQEGALVFPH